MNEEARKFLASGILEDYLLGMTTPEQNQRVESYIDKYPEVKAQYEKIQNEIEQYAEKLAQPAPKGSKELIMKAIDRLEPDSNVNTAPPTSSYRNLAFGLGLIALLSCSLAFLQWNNGQDLSYQNEVLQKEYESLKADCESQQVQYASLEKQQQLLKHPATQKILLAGNTNAPALQTVAFWNNETQAAHLDIAHHPQLPEKHCLQIWADVDGKMVDLGVLPKQSKFIDLPYKLNATSLNITIEPDGGSEHPTVSRLVASVVVNG